MSDVDIVILMGSTSDWKHLKGAVDILEDFGIKFRVHVSSAHRTPERTVDLVRQSEAQGCRAFICAAGMAAHLAGVVAAHTVRPVLGVPLPGGVMDGMDALLATVQMPAGIPVATFAVGPAGARNAAFFAAQLIADRRPDVAEKLVARRRQDAERIEAAEREVVAAIEGVHS